MKPMLILVVVVCLMLSACATGDNRPFIDNGNGSQSVQQTVNDADTQVKNFFDQAMPVVKTVATSLTQMANTIFQAVPGLGVNTDEVEKIRQEIRAGG